MTVIHVVVGSLMRRMQTSRTQPGTTSKYETNWKLGVDDECHSTLSFVESTVPGGRGDHHAGRKGGGPSLAVRLVPVGFNQGDDALLDRGCADHGSLGSSSLVRAVNEPTYVPSGESKCPACRARENFRRDIKNSEIAKKCVCQVVVLGGVELKRTAQS